MGSLRAAEFAATEEMGIGSRVVGLKAHLRSNFYPPLPSFVKAGIIQQFELFWENPHDDWEEMAARCYLKDAEALFRYFGAFIELGVNNSAEAFDDAD